tara:strand:- start:64 stop:288 length:225 start_codon:yes stop_codon:yes gene_type:complete
MTTYITILRQDKPHPDAVDAIKDEISKLAHVQAMNQIEAIMDGTDSAAVSQADSALHLLGHRQDLINKRSRGEV